MQEPLSTNVSANEKVLIKPVVGHLDGNADMCAINWFNLKTPLPVFPNSLALKRCFQRIQTQFHMLFCA